MTHAINTADWRSFELQVTQALPLYAAGAQAPAARDGWRLLTGLQLMHLLVEARLSDFHCRVEALSEEDIASAPIAFPLRLEAFLLEGGYNKARGMGGSGAQLWVRGGPCRRRPCAPLTHPTTPPTPPHPTCPFADFEQYYGCAA